MYLVFPHFSIYSVFFPHFSCVLYLVCLLSPLPLSPSLSPFLYLSFSLFLSLPSSPSPLSLSLPPIPISHIRRDLWDWDRTNQPRHVASRTRNETQRDEHVSTLLQWESLVCISLSVRMYVSLQNALVPNSHLTHTSSNFAPVHVLMWCLSTGSVASVQPQSDKQSVNALNKKISFLTRFPNVLSPTKVAHYSMQYTLPDPTIHLCVCEKSLARNCNSRELCVQFVALGESRGQISGCVWATSPQLYVLMVTCCTLCVHISFSACASVWHLVYRR